MFAGCLLSPLLLPVIRLSVLYLSLKVVKVPSEISRRRWGGCQFKVGEDAVSGICLLS